MHMCYLNFLDRCIPFCCGCGTSGHSPDCLLIGQQLHETSQDGVLLNLFTKLSAACTVA
uniref:Uncharacterized protein n=1 Tax=Anguilla anguilla TaxID=7936 RepID=A0A0E9T494_ANGAN